MCKGGTVSKTTRGGGQEERERERMGGLNVKISPGVCDCEIETVIVLKDQARGAGRRGGSKAGDSLRRRETFV